MIFSLSTMSQNLNWLQTLSYRRYNIFYNIYTGISGIWNTKVTFSIPIDTDSRRFYLTREMTNLLFIYSKFVGITFQWVSLIWSWRYDIYDLWSITCLICMILYSTSMLWCIFVELIHIYCFWYFISQKFNYFL